MATLNLYNKFTLQQSGSGAIDFGTSGDTLKVSLHTATYTPNQATHDFFSDVSNEVSGTGYTSGGETLASKTLSESSGTTTFDAADVTWSQDAGGFSNARIAVIYQDSGVAATSPLIGYVDLGSDKGNTAGDLTLAWNASGILTVARA